MWKGQACYLPQSMRSPTATRGRRPQDWPYNLYTMVHSKSRDDCLKIADQLSKRSGISEYKVLFSDFEYKKTSARI